MNNSGDKDILNAHPLALIQVIEQGDAAQAQAGTFYQNQSHFQAELNEGVLTHAPAGASSYFEWYITADPMDIDGGGPGGDSEEGCDDHVIDAEENCEPESMDNDDEGNGCDHIDNLEESGRDKIVTKLNAFFDGSCCLKNLSLTFRGKLLNLLSGPISTKLRKNVAFNNIKTSY